MTTSKTVQSKISELYAIMAAAAAKKALIKIQISDDAFGAEKWATQTERWLIKAGAAATKDYYGHPRT